MRRSIRSSVLCSLPLAAAFFLLHCSSAPADGSDSASAASSADLCATYCTQVTSCDTSQDEDTCNATCDDALGHTLGRLRDDVQSSITSCVDALDCKTVLEGNGISECVDEAKASVAPSSADKKTCQALSDAVDQCGADPLSVATCLDATKIYSDETLKKVLACTDKSCDALDACVEAALGTASNNSGDAGVGEGGSHGDAGRDSGDAGRRGEGGSSSTSNGGSCPGFAPTKADLDANGGWKAPPARKPGSCSAADLQQLSNNFNTAQSYNDLRSNLSASCTSCAFSNESDANWNTFVSDAQGNGFMNFGACYALMSESSCGRAVQYLEFCTNVSCASCGASDFTTCTQSASVVDDCNAFFGGDVQSACAGYPTSTIDSTCGNILSAVRFACGN